MTSPEINLTVALTEDDADDERLDELTAHLMRDMRELGVESAERPVGEAAPEGAKGDPVTLGAVLLAVLPTLLPKVIELLHDWALRNETRRVKIKTAEGTEIELAPGKRLTKDEMMLLIEKLAQVEG